MMQGDRMRRTMGSVRKYANEHTLGDPCKWLREKGLGGFTAPDTTASQRLRLD